MLFYKCRQVSIRMMSPQIVGLILVQLVGVVINIRPATREDRMSFSDITRPPSYPHPTVRVRSLSALDVLKRRHSFNFNPPFISEEVNSTDASHLRTRYENALKRNYSFNGSSSVQFDVVKELDDDQRENVFNDSPPLPLNPTFNARRFKKIDASAKSANQGASLGYERAFTISNKDELKSSGSDSGKVRFHAGVKAPMQYKRASRLRNKTDDDSNNNNRNSSHSAEKSIERSWKNLKRLNSELKKYSPRIDSDVEFSSLNTLVSDYKSFVPPTITKEADDNVFTLLTNFRDRKHKKPSIQKNISNYTLYEGKREIPVQNQTLQSSQKYFNSSTVLDNESQGASKNTSVQNPNNILGSGLVINGTHFNTTSNTKSRQARKRNLFRLENIKIEHKNKTAQIALSNRLRNTSDLFNYTYHISAMDRGSLFPHDPFDDEKDFGKRSLFTSGLIIPYLEITSSSSRKSSVYEALRPRLRQIPSTNSTWRDKLSSLISSGTHYNNDSTPVEKVVLNFDRNDDETFSMSTLETDESTFLPSSENTTDEPTSASNSSKRDDPLSSRESLLEDLENITSAPSIRISSRKIPDSSGNVPTHETAGLINGIRISKIQIQRSGIHRPSLPPITTPKSTVFVFRENKTSVTIAPFQMEPETSTSQTTLPEGRVVFTTTISEVTIDDTTLTSNDTPEPTSTVSKGLHAGELDTTTQPPESDHNRRPKMTDKTNSENVPFKTPKLDPKSFYDYLMKTSMGNATYNFTLPEFRPGNFYRYDGIYPRKPVLDAAYSRPPPFFKVRTTTKSPVTDVPNIKPTTFESRRTSVRISSTFYPNRMQDVTMRFGTTPYPPTTTTPADDDDPDDGEFRDPLEAGFTMEKLAYLLIGTCCGLSVLCLCVVVIAIKCRRHLVEQRLKKHFKTRMMMLHDPRRLKDDPPWHQYDPFLYMHQDSSRSSDASCNCHCVTWSLGARNLETRNPPSTNRSSLYLCGQKKLPFGAASTLRFESMMGRKRSSPVKPASESPESDSLEHESSDSSEAPRQCTCISYTMWPMPVPGDVRRGMYGMCPTGGRYVAGDCSHHHNRQHEDGQTIPRDCPPPVTGSNYLDRSEGVVYWSSNDERLI